MKKSLTIFFAIIAGSFSSVEAGSFNPPTPSLKAIDWNSLTLRNYFDAQRKFESLVGLFAQRTPDRRDICADHAMVALPQENYANARVGSFNGHLVEWLRTEISLCRRGATSSEVMTALHEEIRATQILLKQRHALRVGRRNIIVTADGQILIPQESF